MTNYVYLVKLYMEAGCSGCEKLYIGGVFSSEEKARECILKQSDQMEHMEYDPLAEWYIGKDKFGRKNTYYIERMEVQ